ncbi:MAG: hypothetical protein ACOCQR_02980 [bacterium]
MQCKLFKLYNQNKEETLQIFRERFGNNNIIILHPNLIAVKYRHDSCGLALKYIFNNIHDLSTSQFLFTTNNVFDVIEFFYDNGFFLTEINYKGKVPDNHLEFIGTKIHQLNSLHQKETIDNSVKKNIIATLFKEMKWLETDGGYNLFNIRVASKNNFDSLTIYDNGIIVLEDINNINILKEFFKERRI